MKKALLIVDLQKDFCPGGALAVPNGDQVVEPANQAIESDLFDRIVASRDWHPPNHCSFKEQGGPWPPHCVQNTSGAAFHPLLRLPKRTVIISKGLIRNREEYSLFQGIYLRENDWPLSAEAMLPHYYELFVGGLATDYCVKATCLDATKLGYTVYLLTNACKAVNVNPGDERKALEEMHQAGVIFTTTNEALQQVR